MQILWGDSYSSPIYYCSGQARLEISLVQSRESTKVWGWRGIWWFPFNVRSEDISASCQICSNDQRIGIKTRTGL